MRMAVAMAVVATMAAAEPGAAAGPAAAAKADRDRRAILDLARIPAEEEIGKPIKFVVRKLTYAGDHAFLFASMQDAFGRPIDYTGTKLAREQEEGLISDAFAGLFKRNARGGWTLITADVGPTDESWATWPAEYGAPAVLFKR